MVPTYFTNRPESSRVERMRLYSRSVFRWRKYPPGFSLSSERKPTLESTIAFTLDFRIQRHEIQVILCFLLKPFAYEIGSKPIHSVSTNSLSTSFLVKKNFFCFSSLEKFENCTYLLSFSRYVSHHLF